MVLHFNVTKDKRKAMVQAIEKKIGGKAKYLGVPSCAYEIGNFTVGKNGELEFGDFDDLDEVAPIVDACVLATGVSPAEWNNNEEGAEEPDSEPNKGAETGESLGLTVSIPLEKVEVKRCSRIRLCSIQECLVTGETIFFQLQDFILQEKFMRVW